MVWLFVVTCPKRADSRTCRDIPRAHYATLPARAVELCGRAEALVTLERSFHEALHAVLTEWHKTELG